MQVTSLPHIDWHKEYLLICLSHWIMYGLAFYFTLFLIGIPVHHLGTNDENLDILAHKEVPCILADMLENIS